MAAGCNCHELWGRGLKCILYFRQRNAQSPYVRTGESNLDNKTKGYKVTNQHTDYTHIYVAT